MSACAEAIGSMARDGARIRPMRIATGRIVEGLVVTEGAPFPEGSIVTVVGDVVPGQLPVLSVTEEAELVAAIEAIRRGDFVDGDRFFDELRS